MQHLQYSLMITGDAGSRIDAQSQTPFIGQKHHDRNCASPAADFIFPCHAKSLAPVVLNARKECNCFPVIVGEVSRLYSAGEKITDCVDGSLRERAVSLCSVSFQTVSCNGHFCLCRNDV